MTASALAVGTPLSQLPVVVHWRSPARPVQSVVVVRAWTVPAIAPATFALTVGALAELVPVGDDRACTIAGPAATVFPLAVGGAARLLQLGDGSACTISGPAGAAFALTVGPMARLPAPELDGVEPMVFALNIGPLAPPLASQLDGVGPGPAGGRTAAGGVVRAAAGRGAGGSVDACTINAPFGADDGELGTGGGADTGGVDAGGGPGGVGGGVAGVAELGPVSA